MKLRTILHALCIIIQCHNVFSRADSRDQLKISPLNLDVLVYNVVKHNPSLPAVRSRIEATALAVSRVQVLDDPEITIETMSNRIGHVIDSDFFPEVRFEVAQKIPFPGKLRIRGDIAAQALKFVKSEEITTFRELILQTKKLYYQLFFNDVALRINKENRKVMQRLIDGTLVLYKTGKGKQDDVLKAEVELQKLNEELLDLQGNRRSLIAMINAILNRPQGAPLGTPKEKFSPSRHFDYDILEDLAVNRRSELQGLQAQIDEQKAVARLAHRNYFPDFTVSAMYQKMTDRSDDAAWGVGVSFNLPIWIEKRQKREVAEAEARAKGLAQERENMWSMIRGQIKEILAQLQATEERINLYKTGLMPKTIETLASGETQYRVGRGNFLTVLDTRRQLQEFELEYDRLRVGRELLFAALERSVGLSLEEIVSAHKTRQSMQENEHE